MGNDSADAAEEQVPVLWSTTDFETFYRREYAAVSALTMVLTRSRSAAEDIAQDAFLRAHRDWKRIGRTDYPEA